MPATGRPGPRRRRHHEMGQPIAIPTTGGSGRCPQDRSGSTKQKGQNCDAVGVPADRCRQPLLRGEGRLHPLHRASSTADLAVRVVEDPDGGERILIGDRPYNFNFNSPDVFRRADRPGSLRERMRLIKSGETIPDAEALTTEMPGPGIRRPLGATGADGRAGYRGDDHAALAGCRSRALHAR